MSTLIPTVTQAFDFEFRPATYWPASRTREQLLSRIKGRVRRQMAAAALVDGGVRALNAFLARESLPDGERRAWGRLHPWCMGGEFLPDLGANEVEIACLSLASTLNDQISIRARAAKGHIRIFAVDEYATEYRPTHRRAQRPLSLRELIAFIDSTHYLVDEYAFGLFWSATRFNYDHGDMSPEEAGDFVTIGSVLYPELGDYYGTCVAKWVAAERVARGLDEEDEVEW